MLITKTHLSRRTMLKGVGATIALPFLDAMVPARAAPAGSIASRNGRAMVAPTPFNIVRRERCVLVINMT